MGHSKFAQVKSAIKELPGDFPGGPGVKNPPCNARDVGLITGWRAKVPHRVEQLTLHTATTEICIITARVHVLQRRIPSVATKT